MSSEHTHRDQIRRYDRQCSVVFLKTKEAFGGLSNMASGFPLEVNGIHILTSEALYQACRFPHMPDIQRLIIDQRSPMTAKMKSKPHRDKSRADWDRVRVAIMRWCLRVKLAQNWIDFGDLLMQTGDLPIVEQSRKDDFWGAKVEDDDTLVGMNVLGRLLMELRECLKHDPPETLRRVEPPKIPDLLLDDQPIGVIGAEAGEPAKPSAATTAAARRRVTNELPEDSLFAGIEDRPGEPEAAKSTARRACVEPGQSSAGGGGMIADLPAYPDYKPSACNWMDNIPSHWEVRRNGRLFSQRKETGFGHLPILEVSLKTGVRVRNFDGSSRKQVMSDREKYKRAVRGDIAYNMMRMWQGAVGVAPTDGLISPAYVVATPHDEVETRYFSHLFRTDAYKGEIDGFSRGIVKDRNRLYWEDFKQIPSCYPPPDEQAVIVRFLAEADRRINRLIRNKRRLIELLNEQKQAIITQAVTRGLNPSVRMKASGIIQAPEVPSHWRVERLRHLVSFAGGMTPSKANRAFWDGTVPWVSPKDMKRAVISDSIDHITDAALRETNITLIDPPVVLVVVRGMILARRVPVATTAAQLTINQDMKALVPQSGLRSDYLSTLLTGCQSLLHPLIEESGHGTRVLRTDLWRNMLLPIPPEDEQESILAFLDDATGDLDEAIGRAEREVEFIREYRTRLIADVVTGKLDVRAAAADLPDPADTEPEQAYALDDDADLDAAEEEIEEEVSA